MLFKACATLALATSFAAAGPIAHPRVRDIGSVKRGNDNKNQGFSFIDNLNSFNQQQNVVQIQEQSLQIVDNGRQQQIVQQVNQVLIVDQQQNGFNNDMKNLFRKSNFNNQKKDESTVILMVQEIQVAVDDGRGNQIQQNIFAQSAIVANRGSKATQTVMVFAAETIIAQNVLGGVGGFDNFQNQLGQQQGFNNNAAAVPTATQGVQLFDAKPTWSAVAEDPAAVLGGIWEKELADAQDVNQNQADNELNNAAAEQEKQALDAAKAAEDQAAKDQAAQDQAAQDQAAQEQQAQATATEAAPAEAAPTEAAPAESAPAEAAPTEAAPAAE